MHYYRFHCSNGYCSCDEDYYKRSEKKLTEDELWAGLADYLSMYSFIEPDERFVDNLNDEEEIEAYNEMVDGCSFQEEISEEEYLENANDE